MKRSKFFCEPRLTMSGFLSHAVTYLARSVLVIRRAGGMASFSALSSGGWCPRGQASCCSCRQRARRTSGPRRRGSTPSAIASRLDVERLVGRQVGLAHRVLTVGKAGDVRDESFFLCRVLGLHDDDLGRHSNLAEVGLRKLLLGEVDRGCCLAAVDDLQAFEPRDAGEPSPGVPNLISSATITMPLL
jgi:hypothetical protein